MKGERVWYGDFRCSQNFPPEWMPQLNKHILCTCVERCEWAHFNVHVVMCLAFDYSQLKLQHIFWGWKRLFVDWRINCWVKLSIVLLLERASLDWEIWKSFQCLLLDLTKFPSSLKGKPSTTILKCSVNLIATDFLADDCASKSFPLPIEIVFDSCKLFELSAVNKSLEDARELSKIFH
jgi:hypothetical protein